MKKHFISALIGLLSLVGLYTGVVNQPNQNDVTSIKIEENVGTDETRSQDSETELLEETVNNNAISRSIASTEPVTNEDKIIEETEDTYIDETENTSIEETEKVAETTPKETKAEKVVKVKSDDSIKTDGVNLKKTNKSSNNKETQPATTQPATTQPAKTQPATTQPAITQPATTQPPTTQAPETTKAQQSSTSSYANEVLRLVNEKRADSGLSAFTTESKLTSAANKRAVEIVSKFSHDRPDGSQFFTVFGEYGINPQTGGENIAYGQPSPAAVVKAWMDSPGHRANILNGKFNKLGVGIHEVNGTIYWSQLFTN